MEDEIAAAPQRLAEYEEQLASVEAMLLEQPESEELQAIYAELAEVIELTRELCQGQAEAPAAAAAQQQQAAAPPPPAAPGPSSQLLPPQVAEQIRVAQQRAALGGQGPAEWAVGAKCRALYSGDGNWYNGVVEGVGAAAGSFRVLFEGYDAAEEVAAEGIQLKEPTEEEGGYKGVAAPKRRKVDETAEVAEMPKWLQIKEGDDEKTKVKKRKLAKAYKSKARFARLDQQTKQKADAWKRFVSGKKGKKGGAKK